VVAYLSHRLKPGERDRLAAHEREMLALVTALREWHHYLLGAPFVVYTDNVAVSHFLKQSCLSHKQARWLYDVLEFDFEVHHRPGKHNGAADALSRRPISQQEWQLLCKHALSASAVAALRVTHLAAVTRAMRARAAAGAQHSEGGEPEPSQRQQVQAQPAQPRQQIAPAPAPDT
jgi:hypothetical protein